MELKRYASLLVGWWWLVLLATALAGGLAYKQSSEMPNQYQTTTTLLVGKVQSLTNPQGSDFATIQQLAATYAQLAVRRPVLQATVEALGIDLPRNELSQNVKAAPVAGTQLLAITVVDTEPERAKKIADEIARQLILSSPTAEEDADQEQRRQFTNQQLSSLEGKIQDAEQQAKSIDDQLTVETRAKKIQDLRDLAFALRTQITTWQGSYTELLAFSKGSRTNYLSVLESASIPSTPFSPNVPQNVAVAAAIGFLLAAVAVLVIGYFDDTLQSAEDVSRVTELTTLGSIVSQRRIKNPTDGLVSNRDPDSATAWAYRSLRQNVQFACIDDEKLLIATTSVGPREGKSLTAANLAICFAQAGKRCILVDADLRYPSQHTLFGVQYDSNSIGLTSLFLRETLQTPNKQGEAGSDSPVAGVKEITIEDQLESTLQSVGIPGLQLLPSGPLPANPAELLSSARMRLVLSALQSKCDVLVFDSPPLMPGSPLPDVIALSKLGIGVLLVVESRKTRSQPARLAAQQLRHAGARILGVLINKAPRSTSAYYSPNGRSRKGVLSGLPFLHREKPLQQVAATSESTSSTPSNQPHESNGHEN